jgi:hypothetical protein
MRGIQSVHIGVLLAPIHFRFCGNQLGPRTVLCLDSSKVICGVVRATGYTNLHEAMSLTDMASLHMTHIFSRIVSYNSLVSLRPLTFQSPAPNSHPCLQVETSSYLLVDSSLDAFPVAQLRQS